MLIENLFKQLYRPLCVYAMHYLKGNTEVAEDLVQDCFIKYWQSRPDNGRAFLYVSVRNACIDYLRRQHPEVMTFAPYDLDGIISDEEAVGRSLREAELWERIDRLPNRCREIFLMSKRDGMKYSEIASELGLSEKTVEHQINKALKRLKDSEGHGNQLSFILAIA